MEKSGELLGSDVLGGNKLADGFAKFLMFL